MAVKAEMKEFEKEGVIALAFEASKEEDLKILDAIHTAMLSGKPLKGGYVDSSRIVIHMKTE